MKPFLVELKAYGFFAKILSEQTSEVYPEPCQISKLELFVEKIKGFQILTIFA